MKNIKWITLNGCTLALLTAFAPAAALAQASPPTADSVADALTDGDVHLQARLRYEHVDQDNDLSNGKGLTLRTILGYQTKEYLGLSGLIEFEDSRVVAGVDDYNDTLGRNAGERSVIADPETTELDQALLRYRYQWFDATLGRQLINLDNQRFVGAVAWRQDRQTFDAVRLQLSPMKDVALQYAYLDQRNRIFADDSDIDAKDHLVNLGWNTGYGTLTGYAYLLEADEGNNDDSFDTYGLRFEGKTKLNADWGLNYLAEWATQDAEVASGDFDMDYYHLVAGTGYQGIVFTLGYEVLGSDDSDFGFATPLATLHKFNGWTDQFLNTPSEGLVDLYASIGGKFAGYKLLAVYHDFEADEDTSAVDDLGDELGFLVVKPFAKHYTVGVKYAMYDAGDDGALKVDTDKAWVWAEAKF